MSPSERPAADLYIGLGTNLGDREANLHNALRLLEERVGHVVCCSSFYETAPQDFCSDNAFLNAACRLSTCRPAEEVLVLTQEIERLMGRTQKSINGVYADRIIDIDLLLSSREQGRWPDGRLELPHPRMAQRRFVLEPLCEIAPFLFVPGPDKYVFELFHNLTGPRIEEVQAGAEEAQAILGRVNALLPQLSASAAPITEQQFDDLLHNPQSHLYVVSDEAGEVQGMVTLCLCSSPTGTKCWAEDLVVSTDCRGRGYGRALMERVKLYARLLGAKHLNFTSRPQREAANDLYPKLGYERRQTNVYRYQWNKA